ncbi:hypothetical protein BDW59DRAFT_161259 [Aspergillus cavernicola]|uniref:NADH:flavin oxidoreductase/NADH oxidase N-terminal domain-containing protein n=1 Tax=Aspergillus cavernicola TaxID=176166 RepID=A0ABR4IEE4_9EURO
MWLKGGQVGRKPVLWPGSQIHYLTVLQAPRYEEYEISYLTENRFNYLGDGFDVREYDGRDLMWYYENMPLLKETGYPVLAPSKIPAAGGKYRTLPGAPGHTQNIIEIDNPKIIVEQFRKSVALAKDAGFDGVELLSQGGYLLHNFLGSRSNKRTDNYGGSTENRCRFILEVIDVIIEIWGPGRTGIKICPPDDLQDSAISYDELSETYGYLVPQLVARELGFINLCRRGCLLGDPDDEVSPPNSRPQGCELPPGYDPLQQFGPMIKYPGSKTKLMVNHGYTPEEANRLVQEGKIDLVTFGRPFISNPDLVTRIKNGVPLAINDRGGDLYYGPYKTVDEGYNDWPCAV